MSFVKGLQIAMHNNFCGVQKALDENGPKWAIYAGVAGLIVSGIYACKQTTKLEKIMQEHKNGVEMCQETANNDILKGEYNANDAMNDVKILNKRTAFKLVKLYSGPVILGTISVAGILWGTNKMSSKIATLTTGLVTLNKLLEEYRERVAKEVGKDKEKQLYNNTKTVEVVDNDTGEMTKAEVIADRCKKGVGVFEFGRYANQRPATTLTINNMFDPDSPSLNLLRVKNAVKNAQKKMELYLGDKPGSVSCCLLIDILGNDLGLKKEDLAPYLTKGWVIERGKDGKIFAPIGDAVIDFGLEQTSHYVDEQTEYEEEHGMAEADSMFLRPNFCDIQEYLYKHGA